MVVFFTFLLGSFFDGVGLLFLSLIFFFYFLLNYFFGLIICGGVFVDFLRIGIMILSLLIFCVIIFVGYYEKLLNNDWYKLFFSIFFLLVGLLFVFSISSFLVFYIFFEFVVVPILL